MWLDIGCGEAHNPRLVAARGARLGAFDLAPAFLRQAVASERTHPAGVRYLRASAVDLPFRSAAFDVAMAPMSLVDLPGPTRALAETFRVLRPGMSTRLIEAMATSKAVLRNGRSTALARR